MNEERKQTNMAIYEATRQVPKNACRKIADGKLKGKTDINPMWRIKTLTEQFGPCGQGWYIEEVAHWTEEHIMPVKVEGQYVDQLQIAVYVKINLFYKEAGKWSKPVVGIGGSKEAGKGVGDGLNDEAYKMAYTDAISVACKALGFAADIYWSNDKTKYTDGEPAYDFEKINQRMRDAATVEEVNQLWKENAPQLSAEDKEILKATATEKAAQLREGQA